MAHIIFYVTRLGNGNLGGLVQLVGVYSCGVAATGNHLAGCGSDDWASRNLWWGDWS